MPTKVKKEKNIEARVYTAYLQVLGKKYEGKGTTIGEAILNTKPGNIKGKCILAVSNGISKRERVLMPLYAMKLFNTRGITQDVMLKQVSLLFDV